MRCDVFLEQESEPSRGKYTKELEEGIGIQSPQERTLTPVPSDEDDEDMSLEQIRCQYPAV
jgi:hypothetical protein